MDFSGKVYLLCSRIPEGRVSTYGEICRAMGMKGIACRAVGNALNKNPYSPKVPCHRVVKSDGRVGGFAKGAGLKAKMLASEGVCISKGKVACFGRIMFRLVNRKTPGP